MESVVLFLQETSHTRHRVLCCRLIIQPSFGLVGPLVPYPIGLQVTEPIINRMNLQGNPRRAIVDDDRLPVPWRAVDPYGFALGLI